MAGIANQVWITSALGDTDVSNTLCLLLSLRKTFTSRKLVVVVSHNVSSFHLKVLRHVSDHLFFVNEKWNTAELKLDDFVKLFILTLKSFETCVYLSPTNVVIKNCDDIFDQSDLLPGFVWVSDDELSCFLARPTPEVFDSLIQVVSNNGRSVSSIVSDWTKNRFGSPSCLAKDNYFARLMTKVDLDSRMAINASIYNIVDIPIGTDVENLDFLSNMIISTRNQIYNNDVQPLLASLTLNHPGISLVPLKLKSYNNEPIAIVGMSCRYPGANNLDEFWNILVNGEDATGNPPEFRWLPEQSIKKESHFRKTNAGFLKSPVDEFDAKFFGISPLEASYMDPQQRLLHEVVWEGLENASINPTSLRESMGGVFVASWTNEFKDILSISENNEYFRQYMGNSIGNMAARISFLLGLTGPSIATESGCSSSMVAVHLACKSLRVKESSMALACGVNLILEPFNHLKMEVALSPDGRCKTFDVKANGYARAEGVGVLVLKRLSDAVRNGDLIWGLIRGTGTAQEGLTKSIGTPTVRCEALAMKLALNDACIDPNLVSYVEAHGTGTAVGDPIEVEAIAEAYHSVSRTKPLLIGSVKTNIGHTESCAGIAGIMKVILAMKHELIPAHRNFDILNPAIDLNAVPAEIPLTARKWQRKEGNSRFAGVNSFGITGTDAHAIIEEPQFPSSAVLTTTNDIQRPLHIMKITAASKQALDILLERNQTMLAESGEDFKDLAFTSNVGRADFNQRLVVIAKSSEDAFRIIETRKYMRGETSDYVQGKICFLFTGQGSQYPGMAKQLYETSPIFRIHFQYCSTILKHTYGINIEKVLWSSNEAESKEIGRTVYSQISIFCVQYALLKLWETWGLSAAYVLGHSLGEFAAAVCAGILSVEDALKLVAQRSLLIDQLPQGKMLVVKADKLAVDGFLKDFANGDEDRVLDVAAINSKEQIVIAGGSDLILECAEKLKEDGIKCTMLDSTHAFHSKHMNSMLYEYRRVANSIKNAADRKNTCKFISGMLGSSIDASQVNAEYWVQHTRQPVRYLAASITAMELGCTTFVEIGPQPVLSSLMMTNTENPNLVCLPSLRRSQMDWTSLLNTVGRLYVHGINFDWEGFDRYYGRKKLTSIPHYPFLGKKYWPNLQASARVKLHPLLGFVVPNAAGGYLYECRVNLNELEYLKDHVVGNNIIFPGAGYLEMCLSAGHAAVEGSVKSLAKPVRPMLVEDLVIKAPLALEANTTCQFQTVVDTHTEKAGWDYVQVKIFRHLISKDSSWVLHATARFSAFPDFNQKQVDFDTELFLNKINTPSDNGIVENFYERYSVMGLNFGPAFKSIEKVWIDKENKRVLAKLNSLTEDDVLGTYIVHPVLLDGMMQTMGLVSPSLSLTKMSVPIKIGKFVWLAHAGSSELYVQTWAETSGAVSSLLIDSTGRILGTMSSVELLETNLKAIQSTLDQQITPLPEFYEESWKKSGGCVDSIDLPTQQGFFFDDGFCKVFENKYNILPENLSTTFTNLENLAYFNFLRAFYQLGWKPEVGNLYNENSFFHQLGIRKEYRNYFAYMCEMLETKRIFGRVDEDVWVVTIRPPPIEEIVALLNTFSFNADIVRVFRPALLLQKAGENLADILKGHVSALSILFTNENKDLPSISDFYKCYGELFKLSESFSVLTQMFVEKLQDFQTKPNRKLRILEVGAGTGALSETLLDVLNFAGFSFEYTYTDVSSAFFEGAEQRLKKYLNSITFRKLNLEEDPLVQGFAPEFYDLVLAAEVIHATKDIAASLQNIRMLMKLNGRLLLHETTNPNPTYMLLVGTLDGYWRFQDFALRKNYCILSKDKWDDVLKSNSFQVEGNFSTLNSNHAMILCRKTTDSTVNFTNSYKTWLVFHCPEHPVSAHLCKKIPRNVISITAGNGYIEDLKSGSVILRTKEYDDYHSLLTGLKQRGVELEGIVYCWALNQKITSQEELLQPYFHLIKCIVKHDMCGHLRLSLITSGVVPLGDDSSFHFHASTLWGYTKSLKNEQVSFNCRCIDIVEHGLDDKKILQIFHEIWNTDNENQVAFFGGCRYIPKFVPLALQMNSLELPKRTDRFQLLHPETKLISDLKFISLSKNFVKDEEIEVHVRAYSLNFRDILSVIKPSPQFTNMNVIGCDFSGVVSRTGAKVTKWKVGDLVCSAENNSQALPTHITLHQNHVIPVPHNMTFSEAATLPVAYMTAIYGLLTVAKIKENDIVLIHSAAGGVGLAAIKICNYIGCKIIVTAGSKRKQNYLRSLGISHIFHSRSIQYSQDILKLTGGEGVDVVLNSLTGKGFKEATLAACAKGARFVEMSKLSIWDKVEVAELRPDVHYTVIDLSSESVKDYNKSYNYLNHLIEKKVVIPIPYVRFHAEDVREALQYMENAKHIGKIVVSMPTQWKNEGEKKLHTPMFNEKSTYLITGGLGGIGFLICEWMVENGAINILLVSRSLPSSAISTNIREMNGNGANIVVAQLDVGDFDQCKDLFENKIQAWALPPLGGIIHSAGTVSDGLIENLDWNQVCSTFRSKVDGTLNLHELTKGMMLEHFIVFSSMAAVLGTPGQSNYAAANAFEDALAHYRYSMGLPITILNWGLWAEVGIGTENDMLGLKPLSNLQGLTGLELILRLHRLQTTIMKIESVVLFSKFLPQLPTYLDDHIWKKSVKTSRLTMNSIEFWEEYDSIFETGGKVEYLKKQLQTILCNTLRMEMTDVLDENASLQKLGMDSLMFVEMRNWIQALMGVRLHINSTSIRDLDTIHVLAEGLAALIDGKTVTNLPNLTDIKDVGKRFFLAHTIHSPASEKETQCPLVIVNGLIGVMSHWDSIAKSIANETNRKVVTFDARSHGASDVNEDLSLDLMSEDIFRLCQHLGFESVSIMGHSIGGRTGMAFALTYPEMLEKLVVVDVSPFEENNESSRTIQYFEALNNIISTVDTTSVSLSDVIKDLDGVLIAYDCTRDVRAYLLANIVEINNKITWVGKPSLDVVIRNYNSLSQLPSSLLVNRCEKPVLFLKSENSSHIPYNAFEKIGKIFTMAKFEVVKKADHFPQVSNYEGFMEALLPFLAN